MNTILEKISFHTIYKYITHIFIYSVIFYGLYVFSYKHIYVLFLTDSIENLRFTFTRTLFFYLQGLLTTIGFLLIHTTIKNQFNIRNIIFYYLLSISLIDMYFFHSLHDYLKINELYFPAFKTSKDNSVPSFQYARVLVLIISFLFLLSSYFLVKKHFFKLLVLIFSIIMFIFFYFMHLYVGRGTFNLYEHHLKNNLEIILNNYENQEKLCHSYNVNCLTIDQKYISNITELSKIKIIKMNKVLDNEHNTEKEFQTILENLYSEFNKTGKNQIVYIESAFKTDNLRGVVFGFKKLENDKIFILWDMNNLTYALDLYLMLFTLIINTFLFSWGPATMYVYKIHKNNPKIKKYQE